MDILDRLLEHNVWATRQLLECCRGLSHEQFTQRFEIGEGSLHDTLRHVIGCMTAWVDRITTPATPGKHDLEGEDEKRELNIEEMEKLLDTAASDLAYEAQRTRDENRLEEMMEFTVAESGQTYTFTRGTAITHVLTHGMHHRAQALNMLRQLGVTELPELDVIEWEIMARSG